ncbi:unnamed protein product [Adineta ricciae]|uniref:DFDF domain-containing protein n=1 Tax=Adineta ricciae TaxID=249248 RepID=A0A814JZN1_ADIRI|nr:unnamed protein product [Adineta ricciae]CAF1042537.1 unnamed protein product [Adineta ricciae]
MSGNFIGSKIAIITKSQCRYTGTIIGIDAQASSILLGNVKCFGTENRGGNFLNNQMVGTTVPIMQFANSDIEDLNIVGDEQPTETLPVQQPAAQQPSYSAPTIVSPPKQPALPKQSSIHDDPAIVSAIVSSSNKDLSASNRLIHGLQQMNLSDGHSNRGSNFEESHLRTGTGESGSSWSLQTSSNWNHNQPNSQQSNAKSKFFDEFTLNNTDQIQSTRPQQRWPSNTHSTQTSRQHENRFNEPEDDSGLPVRQPFFSNDRSHSEDVPLQPTNRYQNGHMNFQQRSSYNHRRPPIMSYQQRRPGGGNRETFHDHSNNYDKEFDFETSNRKFNKITSEEEFKQQSESPDDFLHLNEKHDSNADFESVYDKKKSFFDNMALEDTGDVSGPMYNRSRNQDTFGNDRYQRQRGRGSAGGGGYRRSNNNNNYRHQQGNDDFYYRQNNNGYHYRY